MATAESYQYQADTRQLLDLMVHSLYSNKEVFLRELISNASDALDRLRFEALTNHDLLNEEDELAIQLTADGEARTLTVADNGIGMSRDEVVQNIGTIAHSGTRELLAKLKEAPQDIPPEFIGQFGVGFYASFMVTDKITLVTKRAGEDTATQWESTGDDGFEISDVEKDGNGTTITLHLKPIDDENGLEDFTSEHILSRIVRSHSDFVTYPIKLPVTRPKDAKPDTDANEQEASTDKPETVTEIRTLNSMKAIWTRRRQEITDDEFKEFYRHVSHGWDEPLEIITRHAEGTLEYQALLFIPSQAPFDMYYHAYKGGLQLYVKKIKIIDQCEDLLPHFLRFVKGVVESADVPLNVSREMLQQTKVITAIRKTLTTKVLDTLTTMMDKESEKYLTFWNQFGPAMKEGAASDYDNRDKIRELLLFSSSNHTEELTSLSEYVSRMKDGQQNIFYVTGESRTIVENLPHLEALRKKEYEVLYLTEPVDELLTQHLTEYDGKKLKAVGKGEIDLGDEEEGEEAKSEREKLEKDHSNLLEKIQKTLDEYVKQVRLTNRLTDSAACLVGADHDYSPQLEKLLQKGEYGGPKQRRILEINPKHPIFELMQNIFAEDAKNTTLTDCAELLHGQALLSEGLDLPNPVKFSRQVTELMVKTLQP